MHHIIAFSGGLSSFEVARLCVEQYGPADVECVFSDTLVEDEDLYRFVDETTNYLTCQFTYLCYGKDIWGVFLEKRFHGNSRIDTCSKYLKRDTFKKYLDEHHDPADTTLYYGIGAHERHRIDALKERWAPYQVEAPLIALDMTKEQLNDYLFAVVETLGIDPPRLYDMGFEHNNCGGFCVKTGQRQMAHLLRVLPDRYHWHEEQQEKLFAIIGKHGFIRKTTNGVTEYLTLREFREMVDRGEAVQCYQDGSCACFT